MTGETSVRLTNATLDMTARVVGVRADVDLAVLSAAAARPLRGRVTQRRHGNVGHRVRHGQRTLTAGITRRLGTLRPQRSARPHGRAGEWQQRPLLSLCGDVTGSRPVEDHRRACRRRCLRPGLNQCARTAAVGTGRICRAPDGERDAGDSRILQLSRRRLGRRPRIAGARLRVASIPTKDSGRVAFRTTPPCVPLRRGFARDGTCAASKGSRTGNTRGPRTASCRLDSVVRALRPSARPGTPSDHRVLQPLPGVHA